MAAAKFYILGLHAWTRTPCHTHTHTRTYTAHAHLWVAFPIIYPNTLKGWMVVAADDVSNQTCSLIRSTCSLLYSTTQTSFLVFALMTHKSLGRTSPAGKQQHEQTVIVVCKPHTQMCVSRADRSNDVRPPQHLSSEKSNRGRCTLVIMAHCGLELGKSDSYMSLASVVIVQWYCVWDGLPVPELVCEIRSCS